MNDETQDEKPTGAQQAKADAGSVLAGAATGAAKAAAGSAVVGAATAGAGTAGAAAIGALKGAGKSALKTKTGRTLIAGGLVLALGAGAVVPIGTAVLGASALSSVTSAFHQQAFGQVLGASGPEIQTVSSVAASTRVPMEFLMVASDSLDAIHGDDWDARIVQDALWEADPTQTYWELRGGLVQTGDATWRPANEDDSDRVALEERAERTQETYMEAMALLGFDDAQANRVWAALQMALRGGGTCLSSQAAAPPSEPVGDGGVVAGEGKLTDAQVRNARAVIGIAKAAAPGNWEHAAVTAMTIAYTETRLRIYANDGVFGDHDYELRRVDEYPRALYEQVASSVQLPHDEVGSQYVTLGMFQQMSNGRWGTAGESDWSSDPQGVIGRLMTAEWGTYAFLREAMKIDGWDSMDPAVLGERVQVSGLSAAQRNVGTARTIVEALKDTPPLPLPTGAAATPEMYGPACGLGFIQPGTIAAPVDDYPYRDMANGIQGSGPRTLFGNEAGQCVDFIYWRMNRDAGVAAAPWEWVRNDVVTGGAGAGDAWRLSAVIWPVQHGVQPVTSPVAGTYMVMPRNTKWTGPAGHVGYVQAVNPDGSIVLEDYNGFGGAERYGLTVLTPQQFQTFNAVFLPPLWSVPGTGFVIPAGGDVKVGGEGA